MVENPSAKLKMKILFVLPDVDSFHKLEIHFGIAYISGALKSNGYKNIKFIAVTNTSDYDRMLEEVSVFKPDIVGFTSVETQFINVINLSKKIKETRECLVVCGGPLVTISPDCLLDAPYLDGIFVGECEDAFLNFVNRVARGGDYRLTENFYFYDSSAKEIIKNKLLPLEHDLDKYGHPDRSIFEYQSTIDHYGAAPFMFNRGCPYKCAFCSNHALAHVYGKVSNNIRRRSIKSCMEELSDVDERYKFDVVHIWDDLFTLDKNWLYDFLDEYKEKIKKPFMCTTRSNLCSDELFKKLKGAGCYRVHMSLESGNDFIRNKVMSRNISREAIYDSFGLANKHNIEVSATSVIGLPFETEQMIMDTVNLLGQLKVTSPGVNIFYPYKGTRLRGICEEYGLIPSGNKYAAIERRESILESPHITKEKINFYFENFEGLIRKAEGIGPNIRYKTKASLKKIMPAGLRIKLRKMLAQKKK